MTILLFTTKNCANCPRVKNIIAADPELSSKVEVILADEHMDLCEKYNIKSVPTIVKDGEKYNVSMYSEYDLKELVLGENIDE